jgi:hypothetical protein
MAFITANLSIILMVIAFLVIAGLIVYNMINKTPGDAMSGKINATPVIAGDPAGQLLFEFDNTGSALLTASFADKSGNATKPPAQATDPVIWSAMDANGAASTLLTLTPSADGLSCSVRWNGSPQVGGSGTIEFRTKNVISNLVPFSVRAPVATSGVVSTPAPIVFTLGGVNAPAVVTASFADRAGNVCAAPDKASDPVQWGVTGQYGETTDLVKITPSADGLSAQVELTSTDKVGPGMITARTKNVILVSGNYVVQAPPAA